MTFRHDRAQLDRFRQVAETNHRSVSQELRVLIDRHIDQADGKQAA